MKKIPTLKYQEMFQRVGWVSKIVSSYEKLIFKLTYLTNYSIQVIIIKIEIEFGNKHSNTDEDAFIRKWW